jgi:hypothetical protein
VAGSGWAARIAASSSPYHGRRRLAFGVPRSWASREANAPGTRILIAEVFEANRERINAVLDRTLDVIEAAFEARCTLVVKGTLVNAGPDHYARLEAGQMVLRLVSSRR